MGGMMPRGIVSAFPLLIFALFFFSFLLSIPPPSINQRTRWASTDGGFTVYLYSHHINQGKAAWEGGITETKGPGTERGFCIVSYGSGSVAGALLCSLCFVIPQLEFSSD